MKTEKQRVNEHPILFNGSMVRAIQENRKRVTRRPLIPQPKMEFSGKLVNSLNYSEDWMWAGFGNPNDPRYWKCPYGKIGDLLWLRETWCKFEPEHYIDTKYAYRANTDADGDEIRREYIRCGYPYQWKPSIHMPKEAARIWLEITDLRVERLQDIGPVGVAVEGFTSYVSNPLLACTDLKQQWIDSWDAIYADRGYGWEINPWVWVTSFKRIER